MTPAVTNYRKLRDALAFATSLSMDATDAHERRTIETLVRVMEFSCQMAWAKLSEDEKRATGFAQQAA